jgi:hypothetical protein
MAVTIETSLGRERLIDCMRDPRLFLATYNEAAMLHNRNATVRLVVWSAELLDALRGQHAGGRLAG